MGAALQRVAEVAQGREIRILVDLRENALTYAPVEFTMRPDAGTLAFRIADPAAASPRPPSRAWSSRATAMGTSARWCESSSCAACSRTE